MIKVERGEHCIVVGDSIDAMTTATVLVSLGHVVSLYADIQKMQTTLAIYTFEHELQALWQLYLSQNKLVVYAAPNNPQSLFKVSASAAGMSNVPKPSLYWLFYNELPASWQQQDSMQNWITQLNDSQVATRVPLVLSGISMLGVFAAIAEQCHRPWVYYVPYVFLQDGRSYASMLSPTLWLMGEKTPQSVDKVSILQPLIAQAKASFITDITTIEFSRSAIMSMLATRVSFMNEWSRLADYQGVDILEVATIMGLDDRIGGSYLQAGWGFGGQTLPAELLALQKSLEDTQVDSHLMQAVNSINRDQKELIFRKFWQYFDGAIDHKQVSIWGASYKSGSGHTANSAIHPLLNLLWSYHITTYVYALEAKSELTALYLDQPLLHFIERPMQHLEESDAVFILSWPTIKPLPISAINEVAIPVFDAKNVVSNAQMQRLKGDYIGIGRSQYQ